MQLIDKSGWRDVVLSPASPHKVALNVPDCDSSKINSAFFSIEFKKIVVEDGDTLEFDVRICICSKHVGSFPFSCKINLDNNNQYFGVA
jgi:hypothetical protein